MKKILTLFAMLLVTASTLLAQAPLSYQMVVRSKVAHGDFKPNDLVFSQQIQGELQIFEAGKTQPSYIAPINDKTNMNGMLSLTIGNVSQVDVPSEVPSISNINWKGAKIVVMIPDYGIQDTMDIYPVPYALFTANRDDALTTEEIVKYLKKVDTSDFEQVITAFYGNPSQNPTLEKYVVDTVLNYIKANRTAVRNLLLSWLGQMNADDLDTVYNMVNNRPDLKEFINKYAVQFAKDHKSDAKEILLYYVSTTTKGDVKQVLEEVKGNHAFDTVATIIADTAVKYIKAHPQMVQDLATYYIENATTAQVNYVKNYLQQHNADVYDQVKGIVDTMIQHFLDSLGYINNAGCQEYDICSLLQDIQTLENSEFVSCPELGKLYHEKLPNTDSTYRKLWNNIFNNTFDVNLEVGKDSLIYVLHYPNTIYPDTILQANLQFPTTAGGDTIMLDTVHFNLNKGQIIEVHAVVRARCMDILYSDTVTFNFPLQCPSIDTAWNTDAVDGNTLLTNHGVKMSATVDFNYPEKIANYGFVVSSSNNLNNLDATMSNLPAGVDVVKVNELTTENKTNYKLNNTQYAPNENTYATNLDMKYCARKVWYRAFVGCRTYNETTQKYDTTYNFYKTIKIDSVRGPELTLTTDPTNAIFRPFDDSVSVTAQGWFTIQSEGGRKTLEYWIEKAGENKAMLDTMYYWWGLDANNRIADGKKTIKAAPTQDTTLVGNVSVVMFGSTCTLTDSVKIKYTQPQCNDTVIVNTDTIRGPRIIVTPDNYTQKHQDTTCMGVKDTIVLSARSYMIDKDATQKELKDIKKNTQFYDGLVDTFSYKWMYKGATNAIGTADTLKVGVKRDTVVVCELNIKYKNGTQCTKYDSILVHYEFKCGDSLRTSENKYATIDINGYCWTKSNMRETVGFNKVSGAPVQLVHGDQTGDITNTEAKYYITSTILANRFTQEQLGYLYNHDAAEIVCPKGWHLPDTMEWQNMLRYVDTLNHQAKHTFVNLQGDTVMQTTLGSKIAVQNVWPYYENDNPVGFNAYPAGARQINTLVPQDGLYEGKDLGVFWSATKSPRDVTPKKYYIYYLYPATYEDLYVLRGDANYILGFSVRCVKGPRQEESITETCPSTVTDRNNDQIEYATVKIGDQCWMKENLRTNPDFSLEPKTGDNLQPACTYPGGSSDNVSVYGLLYNYPAATSSNLCPEGWRLPTQVEFETLMANVELCNSTTGYVAKALADNGNVWNQASGSCLPGDTPSENNASLFSARPAGWWNNGYDGLGHGAAFWVTPTATNANNYRFYIEHNQATINGDSVNNHDCLSVRCIKAN